MSEWNLKRMYASLDSWKEDYTKLLEKVSLFENFRGHLNTKEEIENYLLFQREFLKELEVVSQYLFLSYSKNQKDLNLMKGMGELETLFMEYRLKSSFIDEALLMIPFETYQEWSKESEIIHDNLFQIQKLLDRKNYVLSEKEEKILANYQNVEGGYVNLYTSMENMDFSPVSVTLSTKEKILVSKNNYTSYLAKCTLQKDRKKIFEALYKHYDEHKNTYANIYKGIVDSSLATMRSRGYDSPLSLFLKPNHIPESVYLSLIETTRKHTRPLKRYIRMRKKYLHLSSYHTYDRMLSFSSTRVEYPYDKAKKDVLEALKPMGEDFIRHAEIALSSGAVDVYPSEGKRSGAFSSYAYGYGPFILLNHTDDLDSAFTLAHECGHSIHSVYADESNSYENKDYEIFVAEIASTFNEQLFLHHLLKTSKDKELKIQALEQQIDGIVSTFYRQTLFADFEYQAHMKAMNGEVLTYEVLGDIMQDLYQTYYGISLDKEPLKRYVWAYIPHLLQSPFYVYQYATCLACSMKIYQDVASKVPGALDRYLDMLKAGGRKYPMDIVKDAGVDLTKKDAFLAVTKALEASLDELEKLLND